MTKWRILHIPSGRFITMTPEMAFSNRIGLHTEREYGIGDYANGEVYEAWFKWRAETKLENIFAGAIRPSKELLLLNDDNRCEFEVVRA